MTDATEEPRSGDRRSDKAAETALFGLTPQVEAAVRRALEAGRTGELRVLVRLLHPADVADLIGRLDAEGRRDLIDAVGVGFDPEVLAYLDEGLREEVLGILGEKNLLDALRELDSDDAVSVIEELDEAEQRRILEALPAKERALLEQSLTYPEFSAGRLMQRELVAAPEHWTVGQTIDFLRTHQELPDDFYDIFVVTPAHKPVGVLALGRLLRAKRPVRIADIMARSFRSIPATMDQEEVALLFRRYGLVSAPVVDGDGRLLGAVTVDDVVDVIDEEAEEDLMRLAGVTDGDLYGSVLDTTRSRFTWLFINLATAILASVVIYLFSDAIERIVALAVLMPVVASMGGNAGVQSVTVAVRALALRELGGSNVLRFIWREAQVGTLNGLAFAVIAIAVVWAWYGDWQIAAVMAFAVVVNLAFAGLAGTLIPLALDRFKVDPAVASGVCLTTVTDVVGFFVFLGTAALFLL